MQKDYYEYSQDKENMKNSINVRMSMSGKSHCNLSKYKNLPAYSIKNSLMESNQYQIRESVPLKQRSSKRSQNRGKNARTIKILTQSDLDDPSSSYIEQDKDQRQSQNQQSQTSILVQKSGYLQHKLFDDNLTIKFQQLSLNSKRKVSIKDFIKHIPKKLQQLINIKKLVINHGNIRSLDGIQVFQNLQELNLKNNDIREVQQLYKISHPEQIRVLNLKGNDIEDYFDARYENLVKYFSNLIQLNDKDYKFLRKKNQQKRVNMKKVLRKTANVQKDLMKTLKRQSKQNYRYLQKYPQCKMQQRYGDSCQYNQSRSVSNSLSPRSNSKDVSKNHTKCKNSRISEDYQQNQTQRDYQNYNMNHLQTEPNYRIPMKQVSLGNIQNIPLDMPMKYQRRTKTKNYKDNANNELLIQQKLKTEQNNRLLINTSQIQQSHRAMLTQPTATFAMQKEKQKQFMNGETRHFMFKNSNKQNKPPNPIANSNVSSMTNNNVSNLNNLNNGNVQRSSNHDNDHYEKQVVCYSVKSANKNEKDFEQPQFYEMDSEISLGGISKISYNCNTNNGYDQPTKRLQRNSISNASFFTTVNNNQNNQNNQNSLIQSQYSRANPRNSFTNVNGFQNQSYITTYTKVNESMDEDNMLKQDKNGLDERYEQFALAFYIKTLRQKYFRLLIVNYNQRKNLPKQRGKKEGF